MILNMVLWSFITLTSIILLIFFIPYRLAVTGHVQWQERKKSGNATINFGGAHRGITISPFPTIKIGFGEFDHPIFSFSLPKKKESPVKKENSKKQKSKTKKKIPYFKIGESTMGEIHFDQFYLNGDIGLPNPMHTGIIYGWSQSLRNLIRSKKFDIEINPQFNNRFETDIRGQFRLRFTPGKVLWQAGKTYFKYKK